MPGQSGEVGATIGLLVGRAAALLVRETSRSTSRKAARCASPLIFPLGGPRRKCYVVVDVLPVLSHRKVVRPRVRGCTLVRPPSRHQAKGRQHRYISSISSSARSESTNSVTNSWTKENERMRHSTLALAPPALDALLIRGSHFQILELGLNQI